MDYGALVSRQKEWGKSQPLPDLQGVFLNEKSKLEKTLQFSTV